ncbi:CHASE3 domain-containing protein [Belnapia sp. F-4-1]|uniref:sensor histidine kinase n=1 Tax=Belnapia sp. F-4-1 TaxID=1545443 RepID=UPI00068ACD2C|nr:sensor histidine kinase [Belnapia sp. F-4-1]
MPQATRQQGRGWRWTRDLGGLAGAAAAAAFLLLALGGLLLVLNLARLAEARRSTEITVVVLDATRAVVADLLDAETGQRGFLLIGEDSYLGPYRQAVDRIWADFASLDAMVMLPAQQARLETLRPLIEAKLAELAETVALRRNAAEAALAVVRTDRGRQLMDHIRIGFGAFETEARRLLRERTALQDERTRMTTFLALGCGALALASAGLSALGILRRRDGRRLVEQNQRLEQQVEERTATLEEANDELRSFAATISHDLRAPARAIGGYAAALEEDAGPRLGEEERDYLARIAGAAERMDALIDDILGYSRLARQDIALRRVPLEEVVEAVLDQSRTELKDARVEVLRPMPAVSGHAGVLVQAVGNLVGNALKFRPPGEPPQVTIRCTEGEGGLVRLWVEDRGIGIAPEHQERIFRPFERLHGREAFAGTGVGLAIVRRVAERLGGRCGVVSASGEGSRFWIDLPRWTEPGEAAVRAAPHGGS